MKKIIATGLFFLALSGCASEAYYQQALLTWHGANQEHLYRVWGYPDETKQIPNGNLVLIYKVDESGTRPIHSTPGQTEVKTNPDGSASVKTTTATTSGGGTYHHHCTTWFELDANGTIVGTSFRGNDCMATQQYVDRYSRPGIIY